jgi:hypothetical protein
MRSLEAVNNLTILGKRVRAGKPRRQEKGEEEMDDQHSSLRCLQPYFSLFYASGKSSNSCHSIQQV